MSAMLTLVQECERAGLVARVVHGAPPRRECSRHGTVAIFEPHCVVAYLVRGRAGSRCFVFRTVADPEPMLARLHGVTPAVRLLMVACGDRRCARTLDLLRRAARAQEEGARLEDEFYLRAGAALTHKAVAVRDLLRALLVQQAHGYTRSGR